MNGSQGDTEDITWRLLESFSCLCPHRRAESPTKARIVHSYSDGVSNQPMGWGHEGLGEIGTSGGTPSSADFCPLRNWVQYVLIF